MFVYAEYIAWKKFHLELCDFIDIFALTLY